MIPSGHDEPVAVVDALFGEEIPVLSPPLTRGEIPPQALDPRLDLVGGERGEGRAAGAYLWVEVHLGPTPECSLETVREVVRDLEGGHRVRTERGDHVRDQRE